MGLAPLYMTYRELNRKSHGLARLLIEKGVQSGNNVGIMLERSIEMIIGILGILEAGGAYLPINPGYPGKRRHYMLADSSAKILLSRMSEANKLRKVNEGIEFILLDKVIEDLPAHPVPHPPKGTGQA